MKARGRCLATNDELRDQIRALLPDKSDEDLRRLEQEGTLLDSIKAAEQRSSASAPAPPPSQPTAQSPGITPDAMQSLMRGIQDYGIEGLSPAQAISTMKMPRMFTERYVLANAMEQAAASQTSYTPKIKPFKELADAPYEAVKGGFMWTLDVVDRVTQDWVFAVADELLKGDTSVGKVKDRIGRVLKGEEAIEFAQLLDHLPAEHKRALGQGLISAKIALQDAPLPPGFLRQMDPVMESLMPGEKASWEDARKVYGFMGDMVFDASLFAGGAGKLLGMGAQATKAPKLARGLEVASNIVDPMRAVQAGSKKGVELAMREMSKNNQLNNAMRSFIVRGTGIKEFDNAVNDISGLAPHLRGEMLNASGKIEKTIRPLRKKGYSVHLTAEERSFDLAKTLAADVAEGRTSIEKLNKLGIFDDFETFSNPENARTLIEKLAKNPGDIDALNEAVQDYSMLWEKMRNVRIHHGVNPSTLKDLGAHPKRVLKDLREKHWQAYENAYEAAEKSARDLLEETRRVIDQNRIQILEAGERGTKSLMEQARIASKITLKDFESAYRSEFTDVVAQAVLDNKALKPAAEYLEDLYMSRRYLSNKAANNPLVKQIESEIVKMERAVEMTPNFVPHVISPEALDAMNRFVQKSSPGAKLNPNAAEDIVREWVEKSTGRPLSTEEINRVIRNNEWKFSGQEGPLTKGSDVEKFKLGPLYRKDHLGGKIIRRIRGTDRELASFFHVDEATVMATRSQDTARASSAAHYFRTLLTEDSPYVRTKEHVKKLPKKEMGAWTKLSDVDGGEQVLRVMPEMRDVYVSRRAATPMMRAAKPFLTDPDENVFLRMADTMKKWWISYTLPLYPAYHNRNSISNIFNMTMAGWGVDPRYAQQDVTNYFKAKALQLQMQRGDMKGVRRLKFHVEGIDGGVDGKELGRLASRLGVTDSGLLSSELEDLFRMQNPQSNWKKWVPGSSDFGLVKGGREVGKWIENSDKLALFASMLERGKSIEESAAIAKKFLGNYSSLVMTPVERKYLTRLFPFYRWTRFNIPLQFEQLFFNPMHRWRLTNLRRLHESGAAGGIGFEEPEGVEHGALPRWASPFLHDLGAVPVSYDSEKGEMSFRGVEGFIPAGDIVNILGGLDSSDSILRFALQMSNPVAKALIEGATGSPSFGESRPFEGREQEFLGRDWPARTVTLMRNLRFLNEFDRMDPFAAFVGPNSVWRTHKRRQILDADERIMRSLLGLGVYKARPSAEILNMRFDQIREMSKKQSAEERRLRERGEALRIAEDWEEDAARRRENE